MKRAWGRSSRDSKSPGLVLRKNRVQRKPCEGSTGMDTTVLCTHVILRDATTEDGDCALP